MRLPCARHSVRCWGFRSEWDTIPARGLHLVESSRLVWDSLWVGRRLRICVIWDTSLCWTRRYPDWWWKSATTWKMHYNAPACTLDQKLGHLPPFSDLTDLAIWSWASVITHVQAVLSYTFVHFVPSSTWVEGGVLWYTERLCDLPSSHSWLETSWLETRTQF